MTTCPSFHPEVGLSIANHRRKYPLALACLIEQGPIPLGHCFSISMRRIPPLPLPPTPHPRRTRTPAAHGASHRSARSASQPSVATPASARARDILRTHHPRRNPGAQEPNPTPPLTQRGSQRSLHQPPPPRLDPVTACEGGREGNLDGLIGGGGSEQALCGARRDGLHPRVVRPRGVHLFPRRDVRYPHPPPHRSCGRRGG